MMENPEEILHSLEEFSKLKPKDIPRELEDYLCFVAKTGDPVFQWSIIRSLFKEKLISVISDFYEACPSVEIPPCPNVDLFNYDLMKNFILEKLDTFAAAPFTVQRICELLTTPRKEYNRIDKFMRALEKNILVVSTVEPGRRGGPGENENGVMNGLESEHPETSNCSDINVEEMDETAASTTPVWPVRVAFEAAPEEAAEEKASSSSPGSVITCRSPEEPYVSIEPVPGNTCVHQEAEEATVESVTITAIPAGVQKRRNSVEPVVSSETTSEQDEVKAESDTLPQNTEEKPATPESTEQSKEAEALPEKLEKEEEPKINPTPAEEASPTPEITESFFDYDFARKQELGVFPSSEEKPEKTEETTKIEPIIAKKSPETSEVETSSDATPSQSEAFFDYEFARKQEPTAIFPSSTSEATPTQSEAFFDYEFSGKQAEINQQEKPFIADAPGIENISPETSSSSPETTEVLSSTTTDSTPTSSLAFEEPLQPEGEEAKEVVKEIISYWEPSEAEACQPDVEMPETKPQETPTEQAEPIESSASSSMEVEEEEKAVVVEEAPSSCEPAEPSV